MPGRNGGSYRYGFNGQEKELEVLGGEAAFSAEFWMYDSRSGRRWNVDPVVTEWESSYATNHGNPITNQDIKGNLPVPLITGAAGFIVDYSFQVAANYISLNTEGMSFMDIVTTVAYDKVDFTSCTISGLASMSGAGLGAVIEKNVASTTLRTVATFGVETTIDAVESVAKQYTNPDYDTYVCGVTWEQTLSDVVAARTMGAITQGMKMNGPDNLPYAKQKLEHATRVAAGDLASAGRRANLVEATAAYTGALRLETAAIFSREALGETAENGVQNMSNAYILPEKAKKPVPPITPGVAPQANNKPLNPSTISTYTPPSDNTRVQIYLGPR